MKIKLGSHFDQWLNRGGSYATDVCDVVKRILKNIIQDAFKSILIFAVLFITALQVNQGSYFLFSTPMSFIFVVLYFWQFLVAVYAIITTGNFITTRLFKMRLGQAIEKLLIYAGTGCLVLCLLFLMYNQITVFELLPTNALDDIVI